MNKAVVVLNLVGLTLAAGCARTQTDFHPAPTQPPRNAGSDPNELLDDQGNTPLLYAASRGDIARVEWLLAHGADVNKANKRGGTPLMLAARTGHREVVLSLVEDAHADLLARAKDGTGALESACLLKGNYDVVSYLLDKGAPLADPGRAQGGPVLSAIEAGDANILGLLLASGASPNCRSTSGEPAVIVAARVSMPALVVLLLEAGSDVTALDSTGGNAMHALAEEPGKETAWIASALAKRGCETDRPNLKGQTPLMLAAERNAEGLIEFLVRSGAAIDRVDEKGKSALFHAVDFGATGAVKQLLSLGASVVLVDQEGIDIEGTAKWPRIGSPKEEIQRLIQAAKAGVRPK